MSRSLVPSRRHVLRAAGVSLTLPLLESVARPTAVANEQKETHEEPTRLVCVGNPYGMIPDRFFPKSGGLDHDVPVLLQDMQPHRGDFTIFSNFDHGISGGHRVVDTFLTGVKTSDAGSMPDGNISIDQRAAEHIGAQTRFASLNMGVGGSCEMCWTRSSVNVPPLTSSRDVFRTLFVDDPAEVRKAHARRGKQRGSILDAITDHAKHLDRRLSQTDSRKLDEYMTSVRDVERQLMMDEHWLNKPKPEVAMEEPRDGEFVESLPVFYDLMLLALQTDSTRVATLEMPEGFNTRDLNLKNSYHGYSHHGKAKELLEGLTVIEQFQVKHFSRFLTKLKSSGLFDSTMVLFGSSMGNGSSHSNKNLPVIVAGGGFRHAGHVILPEESRRRVPLCNLYVTMLQRFGLSIDRFGSSTSTFEYLG